MIARVVQYSGYVQGVGFRYTARSLARTHHVTGYVMNLPDGRVEIRVEGEEGDVDAFLAAVREEMASYIHEETAQDVPPSATYQQFTVRFY